MKLLEVHFRIHNERDPERDRVEQRAYRAVVQMSIKLEGHLLTHVETEKLPPVPHRDMSGRVHDTSGACLLVEPFTCRFGGRRESSRVHRDGSWTTDFQRDVHTYEEAKSVLLNVRDGHGHSRHDQHYESCRDLKNLLTVAIAVINEMKARAETGAHPHPRPR